MSNKYLTYRYKLSENINSKIYNFSKIHQYDNRIDFKNAWNIWIQNNNNDIDIEKNSIRL